MFSKMRKTPESLIGPRISVESAPIGELALRWIVPVSLSLDHLVQLALELHMARTAPVRVVSMS